MATLPTRRLPGMTISQTLRAFVASATPMRRVPNIHFLGTDIDNRVGIVISGAIDDSRKHCLARSVVKATLVCGSLARAFRVRIADLFSD